MAATLSMVVGRCLRGAIRGYQLALSPYFGTQCRFFPTCSNYALEAVEVHGPARGSWMAMARICRCHPLNPGGFDPVPGAGDTGVQRACGGSPRRLF
jgi:hypothetical protein